MHPKSLWKISLEPKNRETKSISRSDKKRVSVFKIKFFEPSTRRNESGGVYIGSVKHACISEYMRQKRLKTPLKKFFFGDKRTEETKSGGKREIYKLIGSYFLLITREMVKKLNYHHFLIRSSASEQFKISCQSLMFFFLFFMPKNFDWKPNYKS